MFAIKNELHVNSFRKSFNKIKQNKINTPCFVNKNELPVKSLKKMFVNKTESPILNTQYESIKCLLELYKEWIKKTHSNKIKTTTTKGPQPRFYVIGTATFKRVSVSCVAVVVFSSFLLIKIQILYRIFAVTMGWLTEIVIHRNENCNSLCAMK